MYQVRYAHYRPQLDCQWKGEAWASADLLEISCFRPESTSHHPRAKVKLLYDETGIFGIFHVEDRYVRCIRTTYQSPVYRDSCVEFFVQPKAGSGYFNFEFNCGGALLCSYITDHRRTPEGFAAFHRLSGDECRMVRIGHSLPETVFPEISEPVEWRLEFFIPIALLERYAGPLGFPGDHEWKANFFKCGDDTSHPHWASWQPLPEKNFHLPECFGTIVFSLPS